jgi:hypothetical protein
MERKKETKKVSQGKIGKIMKKEGMEERSRDS